MVAMLPKVLAVTRRPAELCATKALLNGFGYDVATATNVPLAVSLSRSLSYEAAFVCRHSFSDEERQQITEDLRRSKPGLVVIAHCPGCTGCDEEKAIRGKLNDEQAMAEFALALQK